jgi:hypothetical protein
MKSTKYVNPLLDSPKHTSESDVSNSVPLLESTSALSVTSAAECPKCHRQTVESKLANSEAVMFCPVCAVTMAIPK